MSLDNTILNIQKILGETSMVYVLHHRVKEHVSLLLDMARQHFAILDSDEEVKWTKEDVRIAQVVMDDCKKLVLSTPITERIKELVTEICKLVHNWNINIASDGTLHTDAKFITNAVDMHFSMVEMVQVCKVACEILDVKVAHAEPVEIISAHFLAALDVLHKEGECREEDTCSKS